MRLWETLEDLPRLRAVFLGFALHPAVLGAFSLVRRWVVGL